MEKHTIITLGDLAKVVTEKNRDELVKGIVDFIDDSIMLKSVGNFLSVEAFSEARIEWTDDDSDDSAMVLEVE